MKVVDTSRTVRATAPSRARKGRGAAKGGFSVSEGNDAAAPAVGGAAPSVPVEAVLALQQAPDATQGRSRGLARGTQLLQHLDRIRLGLLAGGIPRQTLQQLASELRAERALTGDPKLAAVLDEIELRARVELAKYGD